MKHLTLSLALLLVSGPALAEQIIGLSAAKELFAPIKIIKTGDVQKGNLQVHLSGFAYKACAQDLQVLEVPVEVLKGSSHHLRSFQIKDHGKGIECQTALVEEKGLCHLSGDMNNCVELKDLLHTPMEGFTLSDKDTYIALDSGPGAPPTVIFNGGVIQTKKRGSTNPSQATRGPSTKPDGLTPDQERLIRMLLDQRNQQASAQFDQSRPAPQQNAPNSNQEPQADPPLDPNDLRSKSHEWTEFCAAMNSADPDRVLDGHEALLALAETFQISWDEYEEFEAELDLRAEEVRQENEDRERNRLEAQFKSLVQRLRLAKDYSFRTAAARLIRFGREQDEFRGRVADAIGDAVKELIDDNMTTSNHERRFRIARQTLEDALREFKRGDAQQRLSDRLNELDIVEAQWTAENGDLRDFERVVVRRMKDRETQVKKACKRSFFSFNNRKTMQRQQACQVAQANFQRDKTTLSTTYQQAAMGRSVNGDASFFGSQQLQRYLFSAGGYPGMAYGRTISAMPYMPWGMGMPMMPMMPQQMMMPYGMGYRF